MSEFLRATLEALSRLARNPATRVVAQPREEPIDWRPTEVTDPNTGTPFTDASAWEFIADQLIAEEDVNTVELRKPPGKAGYTMNIPTNCGMIYFKVRMGIGRIIGRSFHYSKYHPHQ